MDVLSLVPGVVLEAAPELEAGPAPGRKWMEKLFANEINSSRVFLQTTGAA